MSLIERFETAGVAPTQRLRFWNELVDRIYGGTFVNAPSNAPSQVFNAAMLRWTIGELDMIRPVSDPSMVGRAPSPGNTADRVVLHLQCRGTSRHRQGRRSAELSPGDFVLASASEGYAIDLATRHELLVVEFPRAALAARLPDLNDHLITQISGASPGGRVFHDYLLSLWRHGALGGADDDWGRGASEVFFDLAALAVRGSATARPSGPGGALLAKLKALIEARLDDPALRTGAIAAALRVSPRTVQNLFAGMGTTPGLYILEHRLKRAGDRLLADPATSITTLAFDLGFNDSAYFTRCFRRYYGASPSAWRVRH